MFMVLSRPTWFYRLFRQFKATKPRPSRKRCRLGLEQLEDRTVPAISLSNTAWTAVGPASIGGGQIPGGGQVSGRITAIAGDPTNADVIYIGAAGGGVWKTINGGQSWTPLTDNQATLFMGAIAVAPSNPQVIYAGTGEANNSGDS